ncbi:MAG: hypothetical protein H6732_16640 [Alphaproteobacteria bacterium]|nr:hypothetical protein [Alphaproteobacteria bacterium]
MSVRDRPVLGLAAAAAGLAGALSYTVQRLVDAAQEGPAPGALIAQEHIPYYWRCGAALLHALVVALVVGTVATPEAAQRWLARAWLVPVVALPCLVALLAVP